MKIGKTLKRFRLILGYSQKGVGSMCRITQEHISMLENNIHKPNPEKFNSLTTALNVDQSLVYLLSIDPETDLREPYRTKFNELFPKFKENVEAFYELYKMQTDDRTGLRKVS